MENIIQDIWPPLILLTIIWATLVTVFLFLRSQSKKQRSFLENNDSRPLTNKEIENFRTEVDELAKYVSKLPRPKDVIKDFNIDSLEEDSN